MPIYRTAEGGWMHLNLGRRRGPPACREKRSDGTVCGCITKFQCDWKMDAGATCDRHLCPAHALEVGTDKHLCPMHQAAYQQWKAAREGRDGARTAG